MTAPVGEVLYHEAVNQQDLDNKASGRLAMNLEEYFKRLHRLAEQQDRQDQKRDKNGTSKFSL